MLYNGWASFLASFGFGILFHVKGTRLISASFIGGTGGMTYVVMLKLGYSTPLALFIASIVISLLSEMFARFHKCPVTMFLVCALIPLVPGGGMYYTMLEVVKNNLDLAIFKGIHTLIEACSIVIGCLTVTSCFHVFRQMKKEVIKR